MRSMLPPRRSRSRHQSMAAHTLAELLVGIGVFSVMVVGLLSLHMFGLRQDQLVQSKLGASDQSRRAFSKLLSEVRGSKVIRVGNGTQNSFSVIPNGNPQRGTGLQLSLTTATNNYIRYYYDTNSAELRRMESGVSGYKVIADHLTNSLLFYAEDYRGSNLYDGTHSYAIHTILQFYQYQYPLTKVGPGYLFDYYKLDFRATRRAHD